MEAFTKKIIEKQLEGLNKMGEEGMLTEKSLKEETDLRSSNKNVDDLLQEQEKLKTKLEELKKENYLLQITINAWQTTLTKKLEEFKEADFKLNEIYNEIWSEREEFCSKADKFNEKNGILSDWWQTQVKYMNDLKDLGKKRDEDKKHQREIENLEREVEELKKEIAKFRRPEKVSQVEVHLTEDGDSIKIRKTEPEVLPKTPSKVRATKKKVRFLEEEEIQYCPEDFPDLFSMVDMETVRKANRGRNRANQSLLHGKGKKFLTRKTV